jgi:hypothetical protein
MLTIFSRILEKLDNNEIGRKLSGEDLSPPLKIGTTLAILNCSGTIPDSRDLVIICWRGTCRGMIHFFKYWSIKKIALYCFNPNF